MTVHVYCGLVLGYSCSSTRCSLAGFFSALSTSSCAASASCLRIQHSCAAGAPPAAAVSCVALCCTICYVDCLQVLAAIPLHAATAVGQRTPVRSVLLSVLDSCSRIQEDSAYMRCHCWAVELAAEAAPCTCSAACWALSLLLRPALGRQADCRMCYLRCHCWAVDPAAVAASCACSAACWASCSRSWPASRTPCRASMCCASAAPSLSRTCAHKPGS